MAVRVRQTYIQQPEITEQHQQQPQPVQPKKINRNGLLYKKNYYYLIFIVVVATIGDNNFT